MTTTPTTHLTQFATALLLGAATGAVFLGVGGRLMTEQILEAWRINNRIKLRLIERISAPGMRCTLSQRGGRNGANGPRRPRGIESFFSALPLTRDPFGRHHRIWRGPGSGSGTTNAYPDVHVIGGVAGPWRVRRSDPDPKVGMLVGGSARREARDIRNAIGTHQDRLQYLPAVARRLHHSRDLGEAFEFLTQFEYSPDHSTAFEQLVAKLRASQRWKYAEREIDIRLVRDVAA